MQSIKSITPPNILVKDTESLKGNGVYAQHDIHSGGTVEIAPVIILLAPFASLPPRLKTRVFNWGDLTNGPKASALALGYGSLYNHDNPANMNFKADSENEMIHFVANRFIKAGEARLVDGCGGGRGRFAVIEQGDLAGLGGRTGVAFQMDERAAGKGQS